MIKVKLCKAEASWRGEANADVIYGKDKRRRYSWVPTRKRGVGGVGEGGYFLLTYMKVIGLGMIRNSTYISKILNGSIQEFKLKR